MRGMAMIHKCALIARVSDPKQARVKEGSIPTQLDKMKSHIDYKNQTEENTNRWELTRTYILEGISGSKSIQSEEFQKLYIDIQSGAVNTVMCKRLDRVSRSIRDFFVFFDILEAHKVDFVSVTQQIDTTSFYGRFITVVLMALAELEREQISDRMKTSKKARARKGRWTGGTHPFGFDLGANPGELVPNPEEAAVVELMFQKYLEWGAIRKVVAFLNEQGYRTKTRASKHGTTRGGRLFTFETVRRILRSREYIGLLSINKEKMFNPMDDSGEDEQYEEVEATWDPIIDRELFYEVQALMDKGKTSGHSVVTPQRHTYILSDVVYCGSCLEKMNAESTKKASDKRYFRYTCRNKDCKVSSIPAKKLEDTVVKCLSELAFKPDVLARIIEETNARLTEEVPRLEKEIKTLKNTLKRVLSRIDSLVYTHSGVDKEAQRVIAEKLEEKSRQKASLKENISVLEARAMEYGSYRVATEAVIASLDRFSGSIKTLNPSEQKKLIGSLVAKIYWDGKFGLRIGIIGNQGHTASTTFTKTQKFAERPGWYARRESNPKPSGP